LKCVGCKPSTTATKKKPSGRFSKTTSSQAPAVTYSFNRGQWQRHMSASQPNFVELAAQFCGVQPDCEGICSKCHGKFKPHLRHINLELEYNKRKSEYKSQQEGTLVIVHTNSKMGIVPI
jgi:hypothetical protein